MESVKSFIAVVFSVVFMVLCISAAGTFFSAVVRFAYEFFSSPKCPNCAKRLGKQTIRCPRCRSSVVEKQPQEEMNAELYARVKTLVAELRNISEEELTPETHLVDDLGIAGDDGYELLEAFCEAFGITNMTEIEPYEYFGPEAWNPFQVCLDLYYLLFDRKKLKDSYSLTPLYLRDLVKSAEAKRWIPSEA